MKPFTFTLLAACVALGWVCAGCAAPFKDRPSDAQISEADSKGLFGPRPDNYEAIIGEWLRANLKDPDSVKNLKIAPPQKGWCFRSGALLRDEALLWGWVCYAEYNAKNSYGGYVGLRGFRYFLDRGKVVFAGDRSTSGDSRTVGVGVVEDVRGASGTATN